MFKVAQSENAMQNFYKCKKEFKDTKGALFTQLNNGEKFRWHYVAAYFHTRIRYFMGVGK